MSEASGEIEVEVPGRVCLFGEHSDWAGSYRRTNSDVRPGACIVVGTDQTLKASACEHPSKLIITSTYDDGTVFGPWECSLDEKELLAEAQKGGFWSYAAGVAYQIMIYYPVRGLRLNNHTTTLPMKKGLSSSAAFCVLVSRAFNVVYDLRMTVRAEMELAYLGEILTPSRCGRMDQCCAFGKTPTLMKFDGPLLQTTSLTLPTSTIYMVVVDLAASKDTKEILACLNKAYPFPSNEVEAGVQKLLGPINEDIITRACKAIHDGDAAQLGAIMTEAQAEFDKYAMPACPQQLTSPVLHSVLTHPKILPRIFGAKGVGSQGDGCAQMVARSLADQEALIDVLKNELHMRPFPLTIGGAPPVTTCVILCTDSPPALFPASLPSPPSLFPVADTAGVLKPAIMFAVEAAVEAGMESILIAVPDNEASSFQALFSTKPPSPHLLASLPPAQQAAARRLHSIASKVSIVPQPADGPGGEGRALLACRDAVKGQGGVAVLMGAHLYRPKSNSEMPVVRQLLEAYDGTSIASLQVRQAGEVSPKTICVHGQPLASDPISQTQTPPPHLRPGDILRVDGLHSRSTSPEKVRAGTTEQAGLPEGSVLTSCGHFVLSADVFDALEKAQKAAPHTPLELTVGLDALCASQSLRGKMMDGRTIELADAACVAQAASLFQT